MTAAEMVAAADELRRVVRKHLHERGTALHIIAAAERDYIGPTRDLAVEEIKDGYVAAICSSAQWYLACVREMAEAEERSRAAQAEGTR